ncbi:MAG: LPXTG cell wall anchor domain-containing protein [Ruminococcus sp.]|nr:LPXTG cell wall anchor domain-containing protein [Ruminococcus sp.]
MLNSFTNYQTYTLPATGGGWIVPYMLVGMVFISGASVLLIRSRRREED